MKICAKCCRTTQGVDCDCCVFYRPKRRTLPSVDMSYHARRRLIVEICVTSVIATLATLVLFSFL